MEHNTFYAACKGRLIKLSKTEFLLLSRLLRSPERFVTSDDLWRHAWGDEKPFNQVSLHVYICRLRRKLATHRLSIDTMVHVGYRFLRSSLMNKEIKESRDNTPDLE